jgi:hypothetical protein
MKYILIACSLDILDTDIFFYRDLLSNSRLRNSYFSVNLKNMYQLHFSRKKVQLHFFVKKMQLVAVAHFFNFSYTFLRWLRNKNFLGNWDIGKSFSI